jgi:hypothetical protein
MLNKKNFKLYIYSLSNDGVVVGNFETYEDAIRMIRLIKYELFSFYLIKEEAA